MNTTARVRAATVNWAPAVRVTALVAGFTAVTFSASVLYVPAGSMAGTAVIGLFYVALALAAAAIPGRPRQTPAAPAAVPAAPGPDDRDGILLWAACLLPHGDRRDSAVITMAAPLLKWAAEATSKGDLRAAAVAEALAVCRACPVTAPCLSFAAATGAKWGVWGGTTPDERNAAGWHLTRAGAS